MAENADEVAKKTALLVATVVCLGGQERRGNIAHYGNVEVQKKQHGSP